VLLRQIEPGQTVAASLQAPVLFTLAEDLSSMELHVAIDEADVGKVAEGQSAVFGVDAYPDRSYPARIVQLRYASQTIEGVVSYEAVLSVDNSGLTLRPGMTATASITAQQLHDVVLVPNAALRFAPPAPAAERRSGGSIFNGLFPRPPPDRRRTDGQANAGQRVWVLRDGQPVAVPVQTGATDGRLTELRSGAVQPGEAVVVDTLGARS
jgi:HlyD family secretion protein